MKAKVVIGANYGDEGKGLMTDYLVKREQAKYVVRFNGGAQAGHTVCTPEGKRHVFSHFAAGTLVGAHTILGPDFIINPILFFREEDAFPELKDARWIAADERALITTPYDMMLNQIADRALRHGSCGVGINETVNRSFYHAQKFGAEALKLTHQQVREATDEDLYYYLQFIRREWVPERLRQLHIEYTVGIKKMIMDDQILWVYLEQLKKLKSRITCINVGNYLRTLNIAKPNTTIIFEGAQGLGLDMVNGTFPHVTRSRTGLKNVMQLNGNTDLFNEIDVHYVTRAYLTRHGNGPMESELKNKPYEGINETTNVQNEHQGKFRFGHLNVTDLRKRIENDLKGLPPQHPRITTNLVVTCLDQVDDTVKYLKGSNKKLIKTSKQNFAAEVAKHVGIINYTEVHGNTRNDVRSGKLAI